jgi:hypothetical protein
MVIRRITKLAGDNSPAILTAVGVAGTLITAALTARAAFRVGKDVNAGHYENLMEEREPEVYDAKALVTTYWKEFIPPAVAACTTVTCIILANRIGSRRAAALAAAYVVSEKAFDEYKDKVREKFGKKKEQDVRDEVAQDRVTRTPASQQVIFSSGSQLFMDAWTGRYFLCDVETVRKAENDINKDIINYYSVSVSDFYDRIGLPRTDASEVMGWNMDNLLEVAFSTALSEDSRPCVVMTFKTTPIKDFSRLG